MNHIKHLAIFILAGFPFLMGCKNDDDTLETPQSSEWKRSDQNPVLNDVHVGGGYESASDSHVFYDEIGQLKMIYSGDVNDHPSIKLSSGTSYTDWEKLGGILTEPGPSNLDINKETPFYKLSGNGKHQIYYIGYENEDSFQSEIYLAEADSLNGPYTQQANPVVPRGLIAGKDVYCITSPSVLEFNELLYMVFIGWNAAPNAVTEVWMIGCTSDDDGQTWTNFQLVETPIGMEGQITKSPTGVFNAVRTAEYGSKEAIYLSTSSHPFGPYIAQEKPILIQAGAPLETDELIGAQLTFDSQNGDPILFYTGANHATGWWIMMATPN